MPGDGAGKRGNAAGGAARRWLAERRKALGLTQEALANLMGVERSTVVRWERGETTPQPWMRPRLARALQVSADRLGELLGHGAAPGPGSSRAGADGPDAGARPHQLPPAVAGFTGRAAELAALTKILDSAGDGAAAPGTVVISAIGGTAGVGKTALAIQWAHQTAGRFPDGQLYVNLRGYDPDRPTPPGDALAGLLRALGVGGQDIPPEEDQRAALYRSLLAGRRVLVVLDNAGSAEQVRPLLPGSPACAVVVTSRDSLTGLVARDGAARVDLGPLPPADAVLLLRDLIGDRAAASPDATAALAERCCWLPLALRVAAELAADRPGVPVADLAADLAALSPSVPFTGHAAEPGTQRRLLDLLDAGGDPRTAVRAVFSWSYRRLDPGTARAFRLASLHPGVDFDSYAAAALTDATLGHATRTLDALARAHLIQSAGPGRYAMHDLLRAYASELAQTHDGTDGRHAALTRLLDHYLSAAATAMDSMYPADRDWRPRVDPAGTPAPPLSGAAAAQSWLDGERAALTAVTQYAAWHGWAEHTTRLSATLRNYFVYGGHYPEATLINASARLAASQLGDRAAEGAAVNALAVIDARQGRFQQAAGRFQEASDLFRQAGDRRGEARALSGLGASHAEQGRYQRATGFFEQALSVQREIGDRVSEATTLGNLGFITAVLGRHQQATEILRECLDICRETADRRQECWTLLALGEVALLRGDYQLADDLLGQGLAMSRADGYRRHENRALTRLGDLRRHQGRTEAAAGHLRTALALCGELEDRDGEAVALNRLGEVHLADGRPGDARDQLSAALGLATENGNRLEQARARDGLGHAYHALGDAAEASRHWQEALAIYTDLDIPEAAQVRARLDETD
jgi:tetratricopeptide (TPR) repeat protein/transcriptional regulator with XRE-family HTH domain